MNDKLSIKEKKYFNSKINEVYKKDKDSSDFSSFETAYDNMLSTLKNEIKDPVKYKKYIYWRYSTVRNMYTPVNSMAVAWVATAVSTVCSSIFNPDMFNGITSVKNMLLALFFAFIVALLIMLLVFIVSSSIIVPFLLFSTKGRYISKSNIEITKLSNEIGMEDLAAEHYVNRGSMLKSYSCNGILSIVISAAVMIIYYWLERN